MTSGEHFLFASIANVSEMGIFVRSDAPLPVGTPVSLRFPGGEGERGLPAPLELDGIVVWVNPLRLGAPGPNPGMGVRFEALRPEQRERLVALVRTVAYLGDQRHLSN